MAGTGDPPARQIRKAKSTGTIPTDRQNSTAQVPAVSIWRKISPWVDHKTPAATTSTIPSPYRIDRPPHCGQNRMARGARLFQSRQAAGHSRG
jgi:hypothetical protein